MLTVYKYPLGITDEQIVAMPGGADILSAQMQGDLPHLWALCDSERPAVFRKIRIAGTGHPLPHSEMNFLGTIQMRGGALVFHVFEDCLTVPEEK